MRGCWAPNLGTPDDPADRDGTTGPRGSTGPRGLPGDQGIPGKNGKIGRDGDPGPTGPTGPAGPPATVPKSGAIFFAIELLNRIDTWFCADK